MPRCLPHNLSLERLDGKIAQFLVDHQNGSPRAVEFLRRLLPNSPEDLNEEVLDRQVDETLVRQLVAADFGFNSWKQLEFFVTLGREPEHPLFVEPNFQRTACINYLIGDNPETIDEARAMWSADPTLAQADIYSACCVGDEDAVRDFLDQDPTLVNQRGGFFDWEPIMYACYSRLNAPEHCTMACARLLLERGADPNAHYMWGAQYRFTALTGVFGEGEGGPINLPAHPKCEAFARLLLEAGADPNDAQALYNRMFTDGHLCLQILLEYGLNKDHLCNWLLHESVDDYEFGLLVSNPETTLRYQLNWAITHHHTERARLIIDSGVDLSIRDGESPYEMAMVAGNPDLADYLVAHGAERSELTPVTAFAAACLAADEPAALELLHKQPNLMQELEQEDDEVLHNAASGNRVDAVRLLVKLGANINLRTRNTPLHEAAWAANLEMVDLLVELGADVTIRDQWFHATPLGWARHRGNDEIVDRLAECEIDIFDAAAVNQLDRLREIIAADADQVHLNFGQIHDSEERQEYDWKTPLVIAVATGHLEAAQLLIDHGAQTELKNDDGKTLLQLAKEESTPEMVELLERA